MMAYDLTDLSKRTEVVALHQVSKVFQLRTKHRLRHRAQSGTDVVYAVTHVSLSLLKGESLGIVGESGSGKSTLGRLIAGLITPSQGEILIEGSPKSISSGVAFPVQMVFQDPRASLDPRMRVGRSILEPLQEGIPWRKSSRLENALDEVGLPRDLGYRYPHELSGGQAQRVCLARSLIADSSVVVLDEAVSSLDVSTQYDILKLLREIRLTRQVSYVFISHDLRAVRAVTTHIAVMYSGSVVELQITSEEQDTHLHPYTVALHSVEPDLLGDKQRRIILQGDPPSMAILSTGCSFQPRCPVAKERCVIDRPELREVEPGHFVACHYPGSLRSIPRKDQD